LSSSNQNFSKQKELLKAEQNYVGSTVIKVNKTNTRLDLFIAS